MLRRKLLTILGSLVLLLAVVAAVAVWRLQAVLDQIDHVNLEAMALVEQVNRLGTDLTAVEAELYELEMGRQRRLDTLIRQVESMATVAAGMADHYALASGPGETVYRRVRQALPEFSEQVGSLATTRDPELARHHNREALKLSVSLRLDILALSEIARAHARAEQQALAAQFRWLVFGMALIFLLVINVSAVLLWRVATIILRPVDKLVAASRQLAAERFDWRVQLDQHDEFGELAGAFNHLAEQLAGHEQRRLELLREVARTLNHELNNAMAIIELQLPLLGQPGDPADTERHLRQIHDNLQRMARAVGALKDIRRVVLTDYRGEEKMLDLEQSTQPAAGEGAEGLGA